MLKDITLGDKVKDTVTGLVGIATARCTYLNGCDHIAIQPPAKDGKIPPSQWVDLPQVVAVKAVKKSTLEVASLPQVWQRRRVGGPADHPEEINSDSDVSWRSEDMYSR